MPRPARKPAPAAERSVGNRRGGKLGVLTALVLPNFFSVATTPPVLCAALSADLPRMTVSRGAAGPPRVRLPILVTWSQSDMVAVLIEM